MSRLTNQIESFERETIEKYNKALSHLRPEKPPKWFRQFLDESFIPQLLLIGFDRKLCQVLFQIAYPSWRQLGVVVTKCIRIHPRLTRDLNTIRKETIRLAEEKRINRAALSTMSSDEVYDHVRESMEPRNLNSLLDHISVSWIVLPRAYSLLQKNDVCCLMTYLNYLKKENSPDFKKLLARIVTEFIANFSLKYAYHKQPVQAVSETVFYGYTTMFCKNLSCPPCGCRKLAIHCNFLNWAEAFQKRTNFKADDRIKTAIELMVKRYRTDKGITFIAP